MNFALSAIVIIMLLLPGAVAIKAYYSSFLTKRDSIEVPLSEIFLSGIIYSFIIHSAGICFIRLNHKEICFNIIYNIIQGKDFSYNNLQFTHYVLQFSWYILLSSFITGALVKFSKTLIHFFKLDIAFYGLRNSNYWFDLFNGRAMNEEPDFTVVDVFVTPDIIYSGILRDFNYSPQKDEIENIGLVLAKRRMIEKNSNDPSKTVGEPIDIPGDIIYIEMKNVININIRYVIQASPTIQTP